MRVRMYARVGAGRNGIKADAARQPNHHPLTETVDGRVREVPTARFALDLNVPDELLDPGRWPATTAELDARNITLIEASQSEEDPQP